MKRLCLGALFAAFFCATIVLAAGEALAQTVKLELKGEKGKIHAYDVAVDGTLNLDLTELPIPSMKMSIENMQGGVAARIYGETLGVDDGVMNIRMRGKLDDLTLGGKLVVPLDAVSKLLAGQGLTDLHMDLWLDPLGKIVDVNFELLDKVAEKAGGKKGGMKMPGGLDLGGFSPEDFVPLILSIVPDIFPEDEVAVGDTWTKTIDFMEMSIPFLPTITIEYKLVSVEDGVATIESKSEGQFDADFINQFLSLIPDIPLGEQELKINKIDLVVDWLDEGQIKLDLDKGLIAHMDKNIKLKVAGGAKIKLKKVNDSDWNSDAKGDLTLALKLDHAGEVSKEELDQMFPPNEADLDQILGGAEKLENMLESLEDGGQAETEKALAEKERPKAGENADGVKFFGGASW